jgi:hypothetical protein
MHDRAAATGLLSGQSAVRVLTLDDVRLTYVVDGAMGLEPGSFFPDLPAGYWAAQLAHPQWPSAPDVDGDAVVAARHRLLAELERPGTLAFACHFGDQAFGRIERTPDGSPGWVPVPAAAVMPAPRRLD